MKNEIVLRRQTQKLFLLTKIVLNDFGSSNKSEGAGVGNGASRPKYLQLPHFLKEAARKRRRGW